MTNIILPPPMISGGMFGNFLAYLNLQKGGVKSVQATGPLKNIQGLSVRRRPSRFRRFYL